MRNIAHKWAGGTTTCKQLGAMRGFILGARSGVSKGFKQEREMPSSLFKDHGDGCAATGMQGVKRRWVQAQERAHLPRGSSHGTRRRSPPADPPVLSCLVNTLPETFPTAFSNSRRVWSRACLGARAHPSLIGDSCPEVRPSARLPRCPWLRVPSPPPTRIARQRLGSQREGEFTLPEKSQVRSLF